MNAFLAEVGLTVALVVGALVSRAHTPMGHSLEYQARLDAERAADADVRAAKARADELASAAVRPFADALERALMAEPLTAQVSSQTVGDRLVMLDVVVRSADVAHLQDGALRLASKIRAANVVAFSMDLPKLDLPVCQRGINPRLGLALRMTALSPNGPYRFAVEGVVA
jgi:hypothetical protein